MVLLYTGELYTLLMGDECTVAAVANLRQLKQNVPEVLLGPVAL